MAYDKWMERMNARTNLPEHWARFLTLYTDVRSQYSDSVRPDWMATDKHQIEIYQRGHLDPIICLHVSKDVGNQMYKTLRKLTDPADVKHWIDQMKAICTANGTLTRNISWIGYINDMKELTTCNA